MSIAIKVEHLSKQYIIRHQQQEKYVVLRDVIAEKTKRIFKSADKLFRNGSSVINKKEKFLALNDVNFDVKQGDRVGIIGKNGAGKSTLLKVLSRITEPSTGKISIKGRITSLLEVGTGFHPELTGRENIFLNGAILGMNRIEIKQKFDEIVGFSGVEKFLDTPVKRYSSGMYVRLAFAVAAHLESEVLIIDEVLAVGDAEFQKKCLGKMEDISRGEGRTVLFVSHNMTAIESLCNKGLLISNGSVLFNGSSNEAIIKYNDLTSDKMNFISPEIFEKDLLFHDFKIYETVQENQNPFTIRAGKDMTLEFAIKNNAASTSKAFFNLEIKNSQGAYITCIGNEFNRQILEVKGNELIKVKIESKNLNLMPNLYKINFFYQDDSVSIYKTDFLIFEIIEADVFDTGLLPFANQHGVVFSNHKILYQKSD
jgi:lipopolysaccharide transport system ATP-binding protein